MEGLCDMCRIRPLQTAHGLCGQPEHAPIKAAGFAIEPARPSISIQMTFSGGTSPQAIFPPHQILLHLWDAAHKNDLATE